MRTILHIDMDAFFASVEILDHPEYAGQPVIVGGSKDSSREVVSTASYEARKFGVHSAMPITKAAVLCPQGIFLPGRMGRYQEISSQIRALFLKFSPRVEPLSIDEAFLDMTGCEHFYQSLENMGQTLKDEIKKQTGLTSSVGIAPNKFLAKLASDWRKPDGLFIIRPEEIHPFLSPLPVNKIWGVGKKSEQKFHRLGLHYIRDILPHSQAWLNEHLGSALGAHVYNLARGIDKREVETSQQIQSIGHEITFNEDQNDLEFLQSQLARMSEKVGWRLRQQAFYAKTVSIKVRFHDFKTITRARTMPNSCNDDDTIFEQALHLLKQVPLQPVRLLGVTVSNFSAVTQLSLFKTADQPDSKLNAVIDQINRKFSPGTITKGRTLPTNPE